MAISATRAKLASDLAAQLDDLRAMLENPDDSAQWWEQYGEKCQLFFNSFGEFKPPSKHMERTTRAMSAHIPDNP